MKVDARQFSGLRVAELVAVFVLAEVFLIFLDCPISEVHCCVLIDIEGILVAAEADVALFEKVPAVLWRHQNPKANIELPLIDQQGSLNVFLNHDRLGFGSDLNLCLPHIIRRQTTTLCWFRLATETEDQFLELVNRIK